MLSGVLAASMVMAGMTFPAVAEPGTEGEKEEVSVQQVPERIEVKAERTSLKVEETMTARAAVTMSESTASTSNAIQWTSSNDSVVMVDAEGNRVTVTAVGNGAAIVTASYTENDVTVEDFIAVSVGGDFEVTADIKNPKLGETVTFTADPAVASGSNATYRWDLNEAFEIEEEQNESIRARVVRVGAGTAELVYTDEIGTEFRGNMAVKVQRPGLTLDIPDFAEVGEIFTAKIGIKNVDSGGLGLLECYTEHSGGELREIGEDTYLVRGNSDLDTPTTIRGCVEFPTILSESGREYGFVEEIRQITTELPETQHMDASLIDGNREIRIPVSGHVKNMLDYDEAYPIAPERNVNVAYDKDQGELVIRSIMPVDLSENIIDIFISSWDDTKPLMRIYLTIECKNINLNYSEATLYCGESLRLSAKTFPEGQRVTWKSSDEKVAVVDENGVVTAKRLFGHVEITALLEDGSSDLCVINVRQHSLSNFIMALASGGKGRLSIDPIPSKFQWSSEDESIASVDNNGVVTAINPGTVRIVVEVNGIYKRVCTVTVTASSREVSDAEGYIWADEGIMEDIIRKIEVPEGIDPMDAEHPVIEIMEEITVNFPAMAPADGLDIAAGFIKKSLEEKQNALVHVDTNLRDMDVTIFTSEDGSVLAEPDKITYSARGLWEAFDENGVQVTEETEIENSRLSGTDFTFRLAVPSIVDKKYAKVVHTADSGNIDTYYCPIQIEDGEKCVSVNVNSFGEFTMTFQDSIAAQEITLNQTNAELYCGESLTLKAQPIPAGQKITWKSSNEKIASVDGEGRVTAKGRMGSAKITATAEDGSSASCTIKVRRHNMESSMVLVAGQKGMLSLAPVPFMVRWKSTDETIATVDDHGVVTAVSKGAVDIIAEINGVYRQACTVIVSASSGDVNDAQASVEVEEGLSENVLGKTEIPEGVDLDAVDSEVNQILDEIINHTTAVAPADGLAEAASSIRDGLEEKQSALVYVKADLKDMEVRITSSADGTVIVVPEKMIYDANALMKVYDEDGTQVGEEKKIANSKLSGAKFSFRLAVPSSVGQKYAKVVHTADDGSSDTYYCPIHTQDGEKYITVSVRHFSEFELTFQDALPSSGGSGSSGKSYGQGRWQIKDSQTQKTGEWVRNEKGWWFRYADGTWPASRWVELTWNNVSGWYYFNADGYMMTDWLQDDGQWYYLHPHSDGTLGHMYTGWHEIGGKWYYFNTVSGSPLGSMAHSTVTPDGFQVGADGAWIR